MGGITELGYIRLGVSDLQAWRAFAEAGFGLEVHPDSTDRRLFLRLDDWHHRVILDQDPSDDLLAVGLRVAGPEELGELKARLRAEGIKYEVGDETLARDRCVLELITLTDPAGNPLEIFHGPRVDLHLPFHPGRRMFGRFRTAEGGLGHMLIKHRDFEETRLFYGLLGMRGGVEYKFARPGGGTMDLMFMDCGRRDHALAFGMPPKGRINHIMFEADNVDDVIFTYELIKEKYPIAITLGKHANDRMLSFYCVSPSGFMLEMGWGGAPANYQSQYHVADVYGHKLNGGAGR